MERTHSYFCPWPKHLFFHGLDKPCILFCSLDDNDGDADAHDIGNDDGLNNAADDIVIVDDDGFDADDGDDTDNISSVSDGFRLLLTWHLFRQSGRDLYSESCVLVTWCVFASLQFVRVSSLYVSWC